MKNIKNTIIIMLIIILLTGCYGPYKKTETSDNQINVNIAGLKGPTSIGMIKLIDEKALNSNKYKVEYAAESAPDVLTGKILNGDIQISSLPVNLASVLYNKTKGEIQILAVNTIGNLYIVGSEEINKFTQLEGTYLGISGKGSTPDYALNYLLNQYGIKDTVELKYFPEHASLAQSVIAEDTVIALLPQPFVTQVMMNNSNINIMIDLNEEWEKATDGTSELYTGCIIVNKKFAENNKDFISEFLLKYKASIDWVLKNPKEASILVEKNQIMQSAALTEKAIPYCGINFQPAEDIKEKLNNFYKILFDSNPVSVGGKLPDEDFYYKE